MPHLHRERVVTLLCIFQFQVSWSSIPTVFPLTPVTPSLWIWTADFSRSGWIVKKKKILSSSCLSLLSRQEGSRQLKPTHSSGITSTLCAAWRYSLLAGRTFVCGRVCVTSDVCIWWPGLLLSWREIQKVESIYSVCRQRYEDIILALQWLYVRPQFYYVTIRFWSSLSVWSISILENIIAFLLPDPIFLLIT